MIRYAPPFYVKTVKEASVVCQSFIDKVIISLVETKFAINKLGLSCTKLSLA